MFGFSSFGEQAFSGLDSGAVLVSADLYAEYGIEGSFSLVYSDLMVSYSIDQIVYSDINAAFSISNYVHSDLVGLYSVQSLTNYTRAPAGSGYAPTRQVNQVRPAAIQRGTR